MAPEEEEAKSEAATLRNELPPNLAQDSAQDGLDGAKMGLRWASRVPRWEASTLTPIGRTIKERNPRSNGANAPAIAEDLDHSSPYDILISVSGVAVRSRKVMTVRSGHLSTNSRIAWQIVSFMAGDPG